MFWIDSGTIWGVKDGSNIAPKNQKKGLPPPKKSCPKRGILIKYCSRNIA